MESFVTLRALCDSVVNFMKLIFSPADAFAQTGADSLLSPNTFGTSLRLFSELIFGLAIVIILLILTLWVLKSISRFRFPATGQEPIQLLSMRYLEPKKAIALVRIAGHVYIIGVADQALTNLGELSSEETDSLRIDAQQNQQVFKNLLARFRGKGEIPS
jgi:flagellar protein FliO/FliZ